MDKVEVKKIIEESGRFQLFLASFFFVIVTLSPLIALPSGFSAVILAFILLTIFATTVYMELCVKTGWLRTVSSAIQQFTAWIIMFLDGQGLVDMYKTLGGWAVALELGALAVMAYALMNWISKNAEKAVEEN